MGEIEKFNFDGMAEVRVLNLDGEPWFVANDVCGVLGYRKASDTTRYLEDDERRVITSDDVSAGQPEGVIFAPRKGNLRQSVTLVSEPGLYSLIMNSQRPEAKRFKRWITHEVLPTIRKTGGYATPGTDLHRMLAESPIDALKAVAETATKLAEENQALKARVEEDAPKVLLAEEFFESDGLMGIREAARSFSIPQNTFTAMLREWNWMDLNGTAAKAYAVKQGYMENKVFVTRHGNQKITGKLTRRGLERISQKLRSLDV